MSDQQISAFVFLLGYVGVFAIAVRVFGIRRVLWALALIVFLAVVVAFRTLAGVTGGRRY